MTSLSGQTGNRPGCRDASVRCILLIERKLNERIERFAYGKVLVHPFITLSQINIQILIQSLMKEETETIPDRGTDDIKSLKDQSTIPALAIDVTIHKNRTVKKIIAPSLMLKATGY